MDAARLNVRILTAGPNLPDLDESGRAAAACPPCPGVRASTVAVAIENLTAAEADALRREAAAVGRQPCGDVTPAGWHAHAAAGVGMFLAEDDTCPGKHPPGHATPVILSGTPEALRRLARSTPALPAVGRELLAALDGYAQRHFDIRMGSRRLAVGPGPAIMGVVNVTPDSFSDGGRFLAAEAAVAHARRLVADGADLIDVGGESTRPGSDPLEEAEELARVLPVIEALAADLDVPLSIDTRHARVAREAVRAGASLINDITGLHGDPDMARTVADTGAGVVIMHIAGDPKTMQDRPHYDNLMADVCRYLRRGVAMAVAAGVPEDRILIDPGIGFGKTLEHNLGILAHLGQLRSLGLPILVGPSRKRFIGQLTGVEVAAERTYGTAAACALAVAAGALVLRVHDVAAVRQATAVAAAVAHAAEAAP